MTRAFIGLHSPRPVMPSLVRTSTKMEPVLRGKTSTAVIFKLRKSVAALSTSGELCSANSPTVPASPILMNSRRCITTYLISLGYQYRDAQPPLDPGLLSAGILSPCPFRLSPIVPAPSR
jgi:hypothetical protein